MPIYTVNGKTYNIPEEKSEKFEGKFPDATVEYHNEGKTYQLPISKRKAFLAKYPNASYVSEAIGGAGQANVEPVMADSIHYAGRMNAEPTDMQQMADAQRAQWAEAQRRADERQAAGDVPDYNFLRVERPKLIDAPELDAPKLKPMQYDADRAVDESMQRINGAVAPEYNAFEDARMRALQRQAQANYDARVKQNAEEAVGDLRDRASSLGKKYAKDETDKSIALFNPTTMGGVATRQGLHHSYAQDLFATNLILENTEKMIADYAARQNMGGLANLGRSTALTAFNPMTYDLGFTDLTVALRLENALDKADKGEELTDTEQLLIDAAVNRQVLQAYYGELSGWQQAGKAFGESLPFMAQMAANPLASLGKVAGSAVAKKVARHIAKKVSKKALKHMIAKAAGIAAKTVGNVAGGYGMAVTSNIMNTAADVKQRQTGDILVDYDDNGVARYDGRYNIKEAGEAWIDAINNNAFEFVSESLGAYFAPFLKGLGKVAGKGLSKMGMGAVNRWIGDVAKKGGVKAVGEFFDKTQFHGFAAEYGEEIANGMLNAAFVGDMTMEDVFSKDNLIDTAIGLSVMGVLGGAIGTGGYIAAKRHEKAMLNKAGAEGQRLLRSKWRDFAGAVERSEDTRSLTDNLRKVMEAYGLRTLPAEDMRAVYDYAVAYNRYKALDAVSARAVEDGVMDAEEIELRDLYNGGRGALDKAAVRQEYEAAKEALAVALMMPDVLVEQHFRDYGDAMRTADIYADNGDTAAADALRAYVRAKAKHDGMTEYIRDEYGAAVAKADAEIDAVANKKDGNLYEVSLQDGSNAYIVDGVVVVDEQGFIDENNSDELLHVNIGGTVKQVTPDKVAKLNNVTSAAEAKEARMLDIETAYNNAYDALTAQGVPTSESVAAPAVDNAAVPAATAAPAVQVDPVEAAARALNVSVEELSQAIPDAQKGEGVAAAMEANGNVDGANAVREYVNAVFGSNALPENGNIVTENIPAAENAAENGAAESLTPAQQKKAARDEVAKRIPAKGNKKLWTEAAPEDVAEYISLLSDDAAVQMQTVDKYIDAVKAKQEKVDPIEALEMNDEIAFWEGVRSILAERNGVTAESAAPVAENEMQPVEGVAQPVEQSAEQAEAAESVMAPADKEVNTLQNGNNNLNLQQENVSHNEQNQNNTPVGGQVSESVPQGEYREGTPLSGGAQETAARLRERIEGAQRNSKSGLREVENRVTREFAQENDLWIDDEIKLGTPFSSGDEHNNYIDAENQVIYKVNNRMHTNSILALLDRIELHNQLFPNSKYSLAGFTAISKNGDVMPVFAQDFVPDARMATVEEVDGYMSNSGFTRIGDGRYSNGELIVKDLKPRNVLVNPNGDVYVVDAEFEQEQESGENRTNPTENAGEIQEPRFVEETLENGDKRITNYNSRGEVATVATERDGKIVSVDSYDEGVLFEHTEYDENGKAASVTRYDKQGNAIGTQVYVDGKAVPSEERAGVPPRPTISRGNAEGTSAPGQNAAPKKKRRKSPTTPQELAQEAVAQAEENRRRPLRARAQEWQQKLGVQVNVIESVDEVKNSAALQAINDGARVAGWFSGGKVYVYMPGIEDMADLDKTVVHEVVAHKGLKSLMGDKFDALSDKVWESMGKDAREKFLSYVNAKDIDAPSVAEMRAAADEYMAFLAEGVDLTDADKTVWQKIVEFFREFVEKLGVKMSDKDIELLIKASYANLRNKAAANNAQTEGGETRERKVFHGSGAKFDKFDHSFMGAGEGAQAFGWGTYVTEVEGIGRLYADPRDPKFSRLNAKLGNIYDALRFVDLNVERAKRELEQTDNETAKERAKYIIENAENSRKALYKEKDAVEKEIRSFGRYLYTVEIPDDNGSNYLHWEEAVPSNVVNYVKKRLFDVLAEGDYKGAEKGLKRELDDVFKAENNDGYLIYGSISSYLGSDKAASQFLNEMGFVGISYPADGGRAGNKRNYVIFNENDAQIENRTMFRKKVEALNDKFNEELQQQIDGTLPKGHIYKLGMPSEVLQSAGLPYLPIELAASRLSDKSMQDNHPFELSEVKGLVEAVQNPLAIFRSATHIGSYVVLTEIQHDGKNYVVAIETNRRQKRIVINSVRSVHYRNSNTHIANWIEEGLLEYADKKRMSEWFSKQQYNSADVRNLFRHSAKIVESFVNPTIESENSQDTRLRIANRSQEVFVSNARKAVEEIKQEKATPQQWLAMLKKNGGLKAGEDAWMGLSEWLENSESKSLTKQELLDFIDENAIRIEEVEYRDDASDNYAGTTGFLRAVEEQLEEDARYHAENEVYPNEFDNEEDYLYAIRSAIREYKEDPTGVHYDIAAEKVVRRGDGPNLINSTRLDYTTEGLENKREIALTVPTIEPYNASDEVHFGDAGGGRAVAWVRFGETTDSEGKRVLVIDEIQSKRHQDGREKGYKDAKLAELDSKLNNNARSTVEELDEAGRISKKRYDYIINKIGDEAVALDNELTELQQKTKELGTGIRNEEAEKQQIAKLEVELDGVRNVRDYDRITAEIEEIEERMAKRRTDFDSVSLRMREVNTRLDELINNYVRGQRGGVEAAPFEKNWHELAMKRMLRLAAEEGFDKVAWTTGEQQAQRYDMSRQVESIDVEENTVEEFSDGTPVAKNITISTANGMDIRIDTDADGVIHGGEYGGRNIADIVGKELAVKIMQPGNFKLEGEGLRIGGEGMKGFYDRMLPSFVSKYTKKWGAKVGEVTMPNLEQNNTMWSVDITPEMQESVMEGQTMFRKESERRQEKKRVNDAIDSAAGFLLLGGKKQAKKLRLEMEAKRKMLAKEIYSSVLKGDFNPVTLSQIDKFIEDATPANPFGRRISQRLPQRMERALRQGARANAVDALFSRISESAVPANERFSEAGRRKIEERKKELLKGWAIATGNWHTDLKEFTDDTEPIGEGKDSKVYSSKDGRYVIKASKGKPFGKRFRPDIDNIALFNDVFRDTRYEILGYGEIDGEFVRILQQPIVDFAESTPLTSEERREYMQSLGFEPLNDANTAFADGEIVIADLQKGNVVRDAAGNISVIDADTKLHTKDVGGDYTYPPVETDLPEGTDIGSMTVQEDSATRLRYEPSKHNLEVAGRLIEAMDRIKAITGAKGYGSNSAYIEGETEDGEKWVIRVADHPANMSNFEDKNEDAEYILSIVIDEEFDEKEAAKHHEKITDDENVWQVVVNPLDIDYDALTRGVERFKRTGEGQYVYGNVNDVMFRIGGSEHSIKKSELRREVQRVDADITSAVNAAAQGLNAAVEIVSDIKDVPDARRRGSKGWFSNGKVYLVLPNAEGVEDAVETVLHEVVGHKGLRRLFGEKFDDMLADVFKSAPKNVRAEIMRRALELMRRGRENFLHEATEEYLAEQAERGFEDYSVWDTVKALFHKLLRSIGVRHDISDEEIRYMLWRSYKLMKSGKSFINEVENINKQEEFGVGEYRMRMRMPLRSEGRDVTAADGVVELREAYDATIESSLYQAREALQDSMRSLKVFQNFIEKATGKEIPDWMNAYYLENAMSSANKAEAELFARVYYQRIIRALAKLNKEGLAYEEIYDYMMAKHGIERNREMAVREALTDKKGLNRGAYEDWTRRKKEIWAKKLGWEEEQKELDDLARKYGAKEKDYSGLTGMYGLDYRAKAYSAVKAVEGKSGIGELWAAINDATAAILKKQYDTNMMSLEVKNEIGGMYKYYIPLRGFDEKTAGEVYAYMNNSRSPMAKNVKAEGRTSKAENPIAWIAAMAESAIVRGNRNRMKNAFFNLVAMNPNDLVSIDSNVYLENKNGVWKVATPDVPANATQEQVQQIMERFEMEMEEKCTKYPDVFRRLKDNPDIPYVVTETSDMMEHQVYVRRNGKLFVMTVNGNPRLAQAVNGYTNPDSELKGAIPVIVEGGKVINRWLSSVYTTRNPDFVVSNFIRDMFYSNTMAWVKESPEYARKFNVNYAVSVARILGLIWKYDQGKLNVDIPIEKMFYDFMINGGETGYTNLKQMEQRKKKLLKDLNKKGQKSAVEYVGMYFDEINRSVENAARFAAFMTSREMGRTMARSIWDAKEISVNFNKKGAGDKMFGATGQTTAGNIAAIVAGLGVANYTFWNAGVQGLNNFTKAVSKNPGKGSALIAVLTAMGAATALFSYYDDDEEGSYWMLPSYIRQNNFVFRVTGMKDWITLPLPVEYRAIYGMSNYLTSVAMGKEEFDALEFAGLVSQILPLDMLADGGGLNALVPTWAKPLWQNYTNTNWMGTPIAKKNEFNELDPEYKRVYNNVSAASVELSKFLHVLGGGDTQTRAENDLLFEWNPAMLENLANGYLGGYASVAEKAMKTVEWAAGAREYDNSYMLLVNRVLKSSNVNNAARSVKDKYYENLGEIERWEHSMNGWKRDMVDPAKSEEERNEARTEYEKMMRSDDASTYYELKAVRKAVDLFRDLNKMYGGDVFKSKELEMMREYNRVFRQSRK